MRRLKRSIGKSPSNWIGDLQLLSRARTFTRERNEQIEERVLDDVGKQAQETYRDFDIYKVIDHNGLVWYETITSAIAVPEITFIRDTIDVILDSGAKRSQRLMGAVAELDRQREKADESDEPEFDNHGVL